MPEAEGKRSSEQGEAAASAAAAAIGNEKARSMKAEKKAAAVNPSPRAAAVDPSARTAAVGEKKEETKEGTESAVLGRSSSTAGSVAGEGEKKTQSGKEEVAAEDSSSTAAAAGEVKRKTKMVRLSQSQIDLFLSYDPKPLDPYSELAEIDAIVNMCEKELLEEKAMIQRQYEEKGYVEVEVYDDEEEPRALRPGRRRARPGVVKLRGGQVKRVS